MHRTAERLGNWGQHRSAPHASGVAVLGVAMAAGMAQGASDQQLGVARTMETREVAHFYYSMSTGEIVASLLDAPRPADNGVSPAVWLADNGLPCAAFGQTSGTAGVMDSPDGTTCFTSTCTGQIFLDWGDMPSDQLIDCVGITWATQVLDTDTDSDGIGDGVPGFGASWAWFDAENGFDSSATRLDLTGFTFFGLPGYVGTFDPNLLAVYTATVDLAATFSSSIAFEVGDTDSIDSAGTGIFNPGAGVDLDSDGLADFGYALQYIQPGTVDFDGDGTPDGDPNAAALTGWSLAVGAGEVSADGTSYTPAAGVPGDQGAEDAFDIFIDFDNNGVLEPLGTFWYGGFQCTTTTNTPYAQFYMQMYGPSGCDACPADLFPASGSGCGGDGQLNFFDVVTYLDYFNAEDPRADIFPTGGDGQFNFFDINTYITIFNAGCP